MEQHLLYVLGRVWAFWGLFMVVLMGAYRKCQFSGFEGSPAY